MAKSKDGSGEDYSEAETKARADAALKRMLTTPHKPHAKFGKATFSKC